MKYIVYTLVFCMLAMTGVDGGPVALAIAQAGCAALVVACYAAAGATFGTITAGVGTPAAILACNSAFGSCMAAAWVAFALPTP